MDSDQYLQTFLNVKIKSKSDQTQDGAIDSLSRKFEIGTINISLFLKRYHRIIGELMSWINRRQQKADFNRVINVLSIFKRIIEMSENGQGTSILKKYNTIDFMTNFEKNSSSALKPHIQDLLRCIVNPKAVISASRRNSVTPSNNINLSPSVIHQNNPSSFSPNQSLNDRQNTNILNKMMYPDSSRLIQLSAQKPVQPTLFKIEQESKQKSFTFSNHTIVQPRQVISESRNKLPVLKNSNYNQSSLSPCQMPTVHLCESDFQSVFDLSVNIKFGDISAIYRSSCYFEHQMLNDFPVEIFLQKGDAIKAILASLDGARGIFLNPIGFTPLQAFLQKLSVIKTRQNSPLNRPHILNSASPPKAQSEFLYWCYPCSDANRWQQTYTSNSRIQKSPESISSFDCTVLIMQRAISNLSDKSKIGIYYRILITGLNTIKQISSPEPPSKTKLIYFFSKFMEGLSDVMRAFGDEIFASAKLRNLIDIALKFVETAEYFGIDLDKIMKVGEGQVIYYLQKTLYYMFIFPHTYEKVICQILQKLGGENDAVRRFEQCKHIANSVREVKQFQKSMMFQNPHGNNQLRIQSANQFYQAVDIVNSFVDSLELVLSDDNTQNQVNRFPIQNILPDLFNYCMLLEDSQTDLDSHLQSILQYFYAIMSHHTSPTSYDMKLNIIQRFIFKIRTAQELAPPTSNTNYNVCYQYLPLFLAQKKSLKSLLHPSNLIDNTLIRQVADLLILIFNSLPLKQRQNPSSFISMIPEFQSLSHKNGQFKGLISIIQNDNDYCWLLRVLRDLWSSNRDLRMISSNTVINKVIQSRDMPCHSNYKENRDFLTQAFGSKIDKIATQTDHGEYTEDDQDVDFQGFDADNLFKILKSQNYSHCSLRKSSIEQLTMLLREKTDKFKRLLVIKQGDYECVFSICANQLRSGFTSLMGVDALQPDYIEFISLCMRFMWKAYFRYPQQLNHWFMLFECKNQCEQGMRVLQTIQAALLKEHIGIKQNAMKLLEVILFQARRRYSRIGMDSDDDYSASQAMQIKRFGKLVFELKSYQAGCYFYIFKTKLVHQFDDNDPIITSKRVKKRNNPLFKIYLESQATSLPSSQSKDERKTIEQQFLIQSRSRLSLAELRQSWDFLADYLLISWQGFDMEQIFIAVLQIIKLLPTSEQEGQFASDFIQNMIPVFGQFKDQEKHKNSFNIFAKNYTGVFGRHILPYLFQIGVTQLTQTYHIDYLHNILTLTHQLIKTLSYSQQSSPLLRFLSTDQKTLDYLHSAFVFFKSNTLIRGDIMKIISEVIKSPLSFDLDLEPFTKTIINFLSASNSTSQSFIDSHLIKQGMLFLKSMRKRSIALNVVNQNEFDENVSPLAREIITNFNSFGWLIRFTESRDALIRTITWSLLTDLLCYKLIKKHTTIVTNTIDTLLNSGQLYCVKIQVLTFMLKLTQMLEQDVQINRQDDSQNQQIFQRFLDAVHKSGLISKLKQLITAPGAPALFLDTLLGFVSKLIDLDHQNTLSVLTQLDIWTLLGTITDYEVLYLNQTADEQDSNQQVKRAQSIRGKLMSRRVTDQTRLVNIDTLHSCITSIGQLIETAVAKQPDLASYLASSTYLVQQLFNIIKNGFGQIIRQKDSQKQQIMLKEAIASVCSAIQAVASKSRENGISRINQYLSKNPEFLDFTLTNALSFDKTRGSKNNQQQQLQSIMQTQLIISKMGATLMLNMKSLEESSGIFDNVDLVSQQTKDDTIMQSRGGRLIEVTNQAFEAIFETELSPNHICDICKTASIILARSVTAKYQAVKGDFVARLAATAENLISSIYLKQIGSYGNKSKKTSTQLRETINQQAKMAEKQLIWVLEIFKHLFYDSGERSIAQLIKEAKQSKRKSEPSIYMLVFSKLLKQSTTLQADLKRQIIQVLITFASQSQKAKAEFCLLIKDEKMSFLQILLNQCGMLNPYSSKNILLAYLQLLKTLSMSIECVHTMVRAKFVDEIMAKIDPIVRQNKDLKELHQLLQYIFGFLTCFSYVQQGRKALISNKNIFFIVFMVLDCNKIKPRLLFNTLTFLRNVCFTRSSKSEFLLNKKFLPSLLALITSSSQSTSSKIKAAAASTLWNVVYNHQGVKALLSKTDVKEQLRVAQRDVQTSIDKAKYLPDEVFGKNAEVNKVSLAIKELQETKDALANTIMLLS